MLGLARMAMDLAWRRAFKGTPMGKQWHNPVHRSELHDIFPASIEYYRICDRISAGEKP
jgi:hypothetical protein